MPEVYQYHYVHFLSIAMMALLYVVYCAGGYHYVRHFLERIIASWAVLCFTVSYVANTAEHVNVVDFQYR